MLHEFRHAARRLRRTPGFTLAALLTLAAGIGATTAVYSIVHSIVLAPLPFPDSERLVWLDHAGPGIGAERGLGMTRGLYRHYRDELGRAEELTAWTPVEVTLTGTPPERVRALATTPEFFRTLQVGPAWGRVYGRDVERSEGAVAVMSHALWTARFGEAGWRPGQTVRANGTVLEVIGVMAPGFDSPGGTADLWIPQRVDPGVTSLGGFSWQGVARLAVGVSPASLEAEARTVLPAIRERFGAGQVLDEAGLSPTFPPLKDELVRDAEQTLWILLGSVGFLLLLACANVANLMLVRAESRGRETALRRALGAGRAATLRYYLSEGLLVSLGGGALGVGLALLAVRVLVALSPANLPRLAEVGVHPAALGFAVLLTLAAALVFTLLPGFRRMPSLSLTLRSGGRRSGGPAGGFTTRGLLVATQVALALVLLVATGLMSRSFVALMRYDPGFEAESRLTFHLGLTPDQYPEGERAAAFHDELIDRLAALPGVESVGATSCLPLCGSWRGTQLSLERPRSDADEVPRVVAIRRIGGTFFDAAGIALVRGRLPVRADRGAASGPAVISRELAAAYWPDDDPLGRRFRPGSTGPWYTVIGIVEDTPINGFGDDPPPIAYLPLVHGDDRTDAYALSYLLHTSVPPAGLLPDVRAVLGAIDPTVPISDAATMEARVSEANVQTALTTAILGVATGIALLLGIVGIYGVISHAMGRRTREIGIRLALGARSAQVTGAVVRREGRMIVLGLVVGLVASLAATRLMRGLLFEVEPTDPAAFLGALLLLAIVGFAATWLPAHRSSRLDPASTLRAD